MTDHINVQGKLRRSVSSHLRIYNDFLRGTTDFDRTTSSSDQCFQIDKLVQRVWINIESEGNPT